MNDNLVPETRINKHGVPVIKHVRPQQKSDAGGSIPAPSLAAFFKSRKKAETVMSSEEGVAAAMELMKKNVGFGRKDADSTAAYKGNADLVRVFDEFPKRQSEIIETLSSARGVAEIFTKPVPDEESNPTEYTNYVSRRMQSIARLRGYLSGESKTF